MSDEVRFDLQRPQRIGLEEAVYAAGKSVQQLESILGHACMTGTSRFLTRLGVEQYNALSDDVRGPLDYDPVSRTAILGPRPDPTTSSPKVAIVNAGSSDVPVSREAARTLEYYGQPSLQIHDIGVAGLWRLLERVDELRLMHVIIVVAGMEGALPSVIGGLVPGALIAVPSSVGYGVAVGGRVALDAALTSCAPGIVVVNIDNGFGAACAALRILGIGRGE